MLLGAHKKKMTKRGDAVNWESKPWLVTTFFYLKVVFPLTVVIPQPAHWSHDQNPYGGMGFSKSLLLGPLQLVKEPV